MLLQATWHKPHDFQRYGCYKPEPSGSISQVKYQIIEFFLSFFGSSIASCTSILAGLEIPWLIDHMTSNSWIVIEFKFFSKLRHYEWPLWSFGRPLKIYGKSLALGALLTSTHLHSGSGQQDGLAIFCAWPIAVRFGSHGSKWWKQQQHCCWRSFYHSDYLASTNWSARQI